MKVKHLIRELQKLDAELEVATEGCDCEGDTFRVVMRKGVWLRGAHHADMPYVLIVRSDGNEGYNEDSDRPHGWENDDDTPHPYEPHTPDKAQLGDTRP